MTVYSASVSKRLGRKRAPCQVMTCHSWVTNEGMGHGDIPTFSPWKDPQPFFHPVVINGWCPLLFKCGDLNANPSHKHWTYTQTPTHAHALYIYS